MGVWHRVSDAVSLARLQPLTLGLSGFVSARASETVLERRPHHVRREPIQLLALPIGIVDPRLLRSAFLT